MNLTEVLEKLFLAPMSGKQELHRRVTAFVVKNRHRSQLWVSLDGSFIPDVVRIISDSDPIHNPARHNLINHERSR